MSDTPRLCGALSPQTGNDTLSIVSGQPTLVRLRQMPSQADSAFESLRALSDHLLDVFGARLVFVSCRDTLTQNAPEMLFDTARSAFAAERAQLFGFEMPLDVAIGMSGRPLIWHPTSDIIAISEKTSDDALPIAGSAPPTLIAVPYQCGPLLALCVVQPANEPACETHNLDPIAWHCMQYLPEHFRHHPLRQSARPQLLSPQEERIILRCGDGLTDKEIGREMGISPHTVRTHINGAKAKLGAKNKTHAVKLFNELSATL